MTFWKTKEFCGSWRCLPSMLVIQLRNWKTEGLIPQIFFDICTTPLVKSITLQEFGKLYNYFFGANIYIEISIMDIFRHSVPIRMSSEWQKICRWDTSGMTLGLSIHFENYFCVKWLLKHLDNQKRHIAVQNTNEHVFAIAPQGSLQFRQNSFGASQIICICIFFNTEARISDCYWNFPNIIPIGANRG